MRLPSSPCCNASWPEHALLLPLRGDGPLPDTSLPLLWYEFGGQAEAQQRPTLMGGIVQIDTTASATDGLRYGGLIGGGLLLLGVAAVWRERQKGTAA